MVKNWLEEEQQALAEVFKAADLHAVAEQAAARAAPTVKSTQKVWTSLNAAMEFNAEQKSEFLKRMSGATTSIVHERNLYEVLLKENQDLLQDRTVKKSGMNLKNSTQTHRDYTKAHQDHERLEEKLRSARRDEAQHKRDFFVWW